MYYVLIFNIWYGSWTHLLNPRIKIWCEWKLILKGPWTAIGGMRDWHYFGRGMRDMPFFIGGMRDGRVLAGCDIWCFYTAGCGIRYISKAGHGMREYWRDAGWPIPYTYDNTNILLWLKVDRNHHYIRLYLLSSNRNQAITSCTAKIHRNIIFFICRKAKKFG